MAAQAIDTSSYVYLAMTANGWGSSKKSEAAAIKACRDHMGSSHCARYGYVTYRVHPDFEVCGVNGTLYTPLGHAPIKVSDKIKRNKK